MKEQLIFTNEQVDLSTLPTTDTIRYIGLERPYMTIQIISSLIGTGIITIGLIITFWQVEVENWIALLAIGGWLVIGGLQLLFIYKGFRHKGYAIRQRDLVYKSGWLYKKQVTVPFKRIQHVDIKQGVIDRIYGLARLNIYTAGGNSSDIAVPGLLLADAKQNKAFLLGVLESDEEE